MFLCPVCASPLLPADRSLKCPRGHSFDRAGSGYVNLLLPGRGIHGDDKRMVRARSAFLSGGYYRPLMDRIAAIAADHTPPSGRLLDCGCGEGSYSAAVCRAIEGKQGRLIGIDISKDAVKLAAKQAPSGEFAVASVFHLPLQPGCIDGILNLFAPMVPSEYARVLKPSGWVLKATPLPDHLIELKRAIYDEVYPTKPEPEQWEGFRAEERWQLRSPLSLPDPETVTALFEMTPYCYTTSREGLKRLHALTSLTVTAAFSLVLYRKAEGEKA